MTPTRNFIKSKLVGYMQNQICRLNKEKERKRNENNNNNKLIVPADMRQKVPHLFIYGKPSTECTCMSYGGQHPSSSSSTSPHLQKHPDAASQIMCWHPPIPFPSTSTSASRLFHSCDNSRTELPPSLHLPPPPSSYCIKAPSLIVTSLLVLLGFSAIQSPVG